MKARVSEDGTVIWWCPGCETYHGVQTNQQHRNPVTGALWQWNGSLESPTFSPSVLVSRRESLRKNPPDGLSGAELERFCDEHRVVIPRCHCFVRDGVIEFCSDSEHAMAGKSVAMVDD